MSSLSRLALAIVLPLLAACTVYTPAEYRYLEESRADSTRVHRAAAESAGQVESSEQASANEGPAASHRAVPAPQRRAPAVTPASFTGPFPQGAPEGRGSAPAPPPARAEG